MKNIKKYLFTIFAIILGMNATPVNAATTTIATSTGNTTTSWTITREVNDVTNPVTNTFTYTVTAAASNPEPVTLPSTNPTVVFNNVVPVSGTATATGTIDLSSVVFDKVGDYEFIVKETASTDATAYPLDTKEYHLFVSVRYNVDANNVPEGTKNATMIVQPTLNGTKVSNLLFESNTELTYITLSKGVTGNLADKDEYFAFTVSLPGTAGDTYTVTGDHSTDGTTTVNSSTYTVGTTTTLYLKHGQSVTIGLNGTINEIPINGSYTITETGATDYKTYIDGSTTDAKTTTKTTVATNASNFSTNNTTAYINNYQSDVLTGIFINILPFVLLIGLAVIGIYINKRLSAQE
ncbi:MAG: hypothetical protein IKQ35_04785 [Bacilli bacterium]|nr:hypothetical protein [Bacilli bacterium]